MEKVQLEAKKRTQINKASRSALRKNGRVPGIFYSKHNEAIAIDVSERSIHPLVFTSKTSLIALNIEGHDEVDCVIKNVQFDPVTENIVHIDLLGLKKGEKIQLEVPVQILGNAIGIKEGGILQHAMHKLEIECLPVDIPAHLEIDVTNLKLGDSIHASDLNFENITILNPADSMIVAVTHPKVEKEPEPAVVEGTEAVEPEVIAKGKTQEKEEE